MSQQENFGEIVATILMMSTILQHKWLPI